MWVICGWQALNKTVGVTRPWRNPAFSCLSCTLGNVCIDSSLLASLRSRRLCCEYGYKCVRGIPHLLRAVLFACPMC